MRERNKQLLEKLKEIASNNNVALRDVLETEESMWNFVRSILADTNTDDLEVQRAIYLRFLGTIYIAPGRIKKIKENINKSKL
jgi:hypothetical protein